jgi:hypothetical protein
MFIAEMNATSVSYLKDDNYRMHIIFHSWDIFFFWIDVARDTNYSLHLAHHSYIVTSTNIDCTEINIETARLNLSALHEIGLFFTD